MEIKNQTMVITGGGSGLGLATARLLASKGAKVGILDIQKEQVERVAKEIGGLGLVCDVTSEDSVQLALDQLEDRFGLPRVCINCAGILEGCRIIGKEGPMKVEHFRKVVDIDLVGTFIVMKLALAGMVTLDCLEGSEERGLVINIASIAAYEGQIGQVAYSAAKAGVIGMTLPAAREMGKFSIRVVSIAPGIFETAMLQNASEKVREGLLANTIFPKRFGYPEEFAQFVAHIIENPMINGATLPLDAAVRMPP